MTIMYMHNDLEFVNTFQAGSANETKLYDHESQARRAILCHIRSPCPEFCTRLYTQNPFKRWEKKAAILIVVYPCSLTFIT